MLSHEARVGNLQGGKGNTCTVSKARCFVFVGPLGAAGSGAARWSPVAVPPPRGVWSTGSLSSVPQAIQYHVPFRRRRAPAQAVVYYYCCAPIIVRTQYADTNTRACLDEKLFEFWHCSTFVFIWQTLSNHRVTRHKKFVSDLQTNCVISFYFYLYLILHACVTRFDVMGNLVKFWVFACI